MTSAFRSLMVCLAVVAVGIAQVFGMHAGYLCGCTGQRSAQEACKVQDCHPNVAHEDGCVAEVAKAACDDHGESPQAPLPHHHKHSEVRDTLIVTGAPPVLVLPAVVFFELPPTFQVPDLLTPVASFKEANHPEPPRDGSPPMPLLVARTMVMLV